MDSTLASHPAALGSILSVPKIFSEFLDVAEIYRSTLLGLGLLYSVQGSKNETVENMNSASTGKSTEWGVFGLITRMIF